MFVEAFIADYFTAGSTDDETSDVSSDDDLTGTFQCYLIISKYKVFIGNDINEDCMQMETTTPEESIDTQEDEEECNAGILLVAI